MTSFLPRGPVIETLDVLFGLVILADFLARLVLCRHRVREFFDLATWADIAAIVSFLAPLVGEGAGFLRILRTLRLLHTYQLLARLRKDSRFFKRNEEVIFASANLFVFIFVMTAIVYELSITEIRSSPITRTPSFLRHGADDDRLRRHHAAGHGRTHDLGRDHGVRGDVVSQSGAHPVQPRKVFFQCPDCGLQRHDYDAVHCKACGVVINIPNDEKL